MSNNKNCWQWATKGEDVMLTKLALQSATATAQLRQDNAELERLQKELAREAFGDADKGLGVTAVNYGGKFYDELSMQRRMEVWLTMRGFCPDDITFENKYLVLKW